MFIAFGAGERAYEMPLEQGHLLLAEKNLWGRICDSGLHIVTRQRCVAPDAR